MNVRMKEKMDLRFIVNRYSMIVISIFISWVIMIGYEIIFNNICIFFIYFILRHFLLKMINMSFFINIEYNP